MKPHVCAVARLLLVLLVAVPAWAQNAGNSGSAGQTSAPTVTAPAQKNDRKDDAKKAAPQDKPAAPDSAKAAVGELKPQDPGSMPGAQLPPPPPPASPIEPGYFQIEFRYNVDGTTIQGNKSRSFMWEGINHTGESNYIFSQPIGDTWRFEHVGAFRYTDNPRVDPERNSLQRAYFKLNGPSFEGYLGDALVNYSRLSFNQNIKGLHFWKDFGKTVRVTGTFGYFADRWGSLYRPFDVFRNVQVDCQADSRPFVPGNPTGTPPTAPVAPIPASGCVETVPGSIFGPGSNTFVLDPSSPLKPYSRLVGGARVEKRFGRSSWLAVNYSHGDDLLQSLPTARVTCSLGGVIRVVSIYPGCNLPGEVEVAGSRFPGSEASLNDVATMDAQFDYQPWKLHLAGEVASSWSAGGSPPAGATPQNFLCASLPPVIGGAVLDSRCFNNRVQDMAYRAEAGWRHKKLNLRSDYSRFGSDFFSVNARQIRNLEDFNARGEVELSRQVTAAGSFRRSTDNINGAAPYTNIIRAPEGKLILRDLPFYRRASFEVGYRERNLDQDGIAPPSEQRKRSTRIPFFSLSLPAGPNFFTFDYEHRHDMDAVRPPQSSDTDRFAIGYRGNYAIGEWDVSPAFRFEIERLEKNLTNDPARSITDPALTFPLDFFIGWDSNRSYQASLLVEAPKYWRIEAFFREFNSVVLVPTALANPLAGLRYLNQGFRRPDWRALVTYKLANDENKTITVFFERTNNFFNPGDPALADTKSFRETVVGGTLFLRFRK